MTYRKVDPILLQEIARAQGEARALQKPGCFLFNRVSTKMSEQETSLDQQESDSYAYAKRIGLHVVHNFRVQETASKEDSRHVFNIVIQLLKSDLIDVKHLVFKSSDRSSRNKFDKDQLDKLRKKFGVSVHCYSSGKILHGKSHYTDELQDDIENLFATHYSRELSFKIREAYRFKAIERKQAPGTVTPFGYRWSKDRKQHEIDQDVEHIVRAIHSAADSGNFSLSQLVGYCNENGLLPGSGIPWQKGRLEKFLKNPFFAGWFRYADTILEGSHPAYITKQRYDERLERLSSRQNGNISNVRHHLLSRFIKCSVCGRSYEGEFQTGQSGEGSFTYYKHRCLSDGWKKERRYSEKELFGLLDEVVETSRFHPDFANALKELFRKPCEHREMRGRKGHEIINARIARLQGQQAKLLDLFTLSEIDQSELLNKRKQYQLEVDVLKKERAALEADQEKTFDEIVETIDLLREMPLIFLRDVPEGKIKVLRTMADKAVLSPDGTFRISWIQPYRFLMKTEVLGAQASGDMELLSNPTDDVGFKKVSDCAQERT